MLAGLARRCASRANHAAVFATCQPAFLSRDMGANQWHQMAGQGSSPWKRAHSSSSLSKILGNFDVQALEVLVASSFDSILMTDAVDGNITYANKAFTLLTGHETSDVIGKSPKILQGEGTDKKVIARLAEALKSGGDFEGKAINFKKDGTPFIMHWRVVPVKADGEIQAWVAIQREGFRI